MIGFIVAAAVSASIMQPKAWMNAQIEEELSPFKHGIKVEHVEKSFQRIKKTFDGDIVPIILVKISDENCIWEHPDKLEKGYFSRAESFCKALKQLGPLPPMSMLVSLDQDCERPIYLRESNVPIFSISRSIRNRKVLLFPKGILFPDRAKLHQELLQESESKPWEERMPIALWRPKTLRNEYFHSDWEWDQSVRFVILGKRHPEHFAFHLSKDFYFKKIPWWAQNLFLKMGYSSDPLLPVEHLNYRYLLACPQMDMLQDLDWQLCCGSTVIKPPSKLFEWYYSRLKADEHFFSTLTYGEDLPSRIEWLKDNDDTAQKIAKNAQHFAKTVLSTDSEMAYFKALISAYGKLQTN